MRGGPSGIFARLKCALALERFFLLLNEVRCQWHALSQVAQVAQIFGGVNTLSGYVGTESFSAEFSTTASEP